MPPSNQAALRPSGERRTRQGWCDTPLIAAHAGDTLSTIARKHRVHGGWHALYRANRARLSNPNVVHVGQRLILP